MASLSVKYLACMYAMGAMRCMACQMHACTSCRDTCWHRHLLECMQALGLRSALNEKELELLELREQHIQLVVRALKMRTRGYMRPSSSTAEMESGDRLEPITCAYPPQARSQEARANWEAALESKDRAIMQLDEALASRQRALEQLTAAGSSGAAASHQAHTELQEKAAQVGEHVRENAIADGEQHTSPPQHGVPCRWLLWNAPCTRLTPPLRTCGSMQMRLQSNWRCVFGTACGQQRGRWRW